jgi:predicted acetyltransferase
MHAFSVQVGTRKDIALLSRLLQLYFFESTSWSGEDIQEDGLYDNDEQALLLFLDPERTEKAYILRVDEKPAGFVLVEEVEFEGKQILEYADVFVLPKHRGIGLASAATEQIVIGSGRPWLFAVFRNDLSALRYWQRAFQRLPFERVRLADDPEDKRFHCFVINEGCASSP